MNSVVYIYTLTLCIDGQHDKEMLSFSAIVHNAITTGSNSGGDPYIGDMVVIVNNFIQALYKVKGLTRARFIDTYVSVLNMIFVIFKCTGMEQSVLDRLVLKCTMRY